MGNAKLLWTVITSVLLTSTNAQNLINSDSWIVGSDNEPSGYRNYGYGNENSRELGIGPFGEETVLWKADPTGDGDIDGGFRTDYISIDPTKTYRLAVWLKKQNSSEGSSYFGMFSKNASGEDSSQYLNGTALSNPYFFIGDLPTLNEWYLMVAYVHNSDNSDNLKLGGIYDTKGIKILDVANEFKFSSDAATLLLRTFLYKDTSVEGRQYFYQPRIEIIDGNEPTVLQLINIENDSTNQDSEGNPIWIVDGDNLFYNKGKVGIGTIEEDPGFNLTVKGKIHTQEVKVDLDGIIAPDYVFDEDYELKTLSQVQKYIAKMGHLPNIPSAEEMNNNGLNLKEMNLKLLEKIEELTLYTIEQDKTIKTLKNNFQTVNHRLRKLERK